ncbi:MAG TPA: HlyD family efflux transporter periplasmic adaptor subunit [Gemmatimonadales bacterium]|nr:HlyD family efflux transporter periplasmic adaptor subunit [Gemmatimonadales bacterium]
MMRWLVRSAVVALAAALIVWLVNMYREHQDRIAAQAEMTEPVVAPSRVREVEGRAMVVVDTGDMRRLGLRTSPLRTATATPELRLTGQLVPAPERTAAVRAPVAGRLSEPEGGHWPAFGETVEAGRPIAQVSDAKPLAAPRSGVVSQVGAQPGEMVQAGQLLLEITDYSAPLARIAWPADAPPPPSEVLLAMPGSSHRVRARLVGASPSADEITRLPAYLYRAEQGWPGARPGTAVIASVRGAGPPARGVVVPDQALVQWEGLVWAYVQRGAGRFERQRVTTERPVPGGMLATGLEPGDTVVVQGAEQLLSEEFRARVTVGDEPGE